MQPGDWGGFQVDSEKVTGIRQMSLRNVIFISSSPASSMRKGTGSRAYNSTGRKGFNEAWTTTKDFASGVEERQGDYIKGICSLRS